MFAVAPIRGLSDRTFALNNGKSRKTLVITAGKGKSLFANGLSKNLPKDDYEENVKNESDGNSNKSK